MLGKAFAMACLFSTSCYGFVAPLKYTQRAVATHTIAPLDRYSRHDRHNGALASAPSAEDDIGISGALAIDDTVEPSALELPPANKFDLETALFCSGLAFDSYIEPPPNSSRWERGVRETMNYSDARLWFFVLFFFAISHISSNLSYCFYLSFFEIL